jgi:hypothetical protein
MITPAVSMVDISADRMSIDGGHQATKAEWMRLALSYHHYHQHRQGEKD